MYMRSKLMSTGYCILNLKRMSSLIALILHGRKQEKYTSSISLYYQILFMSFFLLYTRGQNVFSYNSKFFFSHVNLLFVSSSMCEVL